MERGLKDEGLDVESLEDAGGRFQLHEVIGSGVNAKVYRATDTQEGGRTVAIKVQSLNGETRPDIEEEYRVLRDLSSHPNLVEFYGAFKNVQGSRVEVWFVLQYCEGGPVTDLIHALLRQNKKMNETHIAFILKEVIKALLSLHENHVIHRDINGSNILLTKNGEVKLCDFGISRELASTLGRCQTAIGSPSWMAPEVVTSTNNKNSYDNRADVWALGITAIELGDGKAPYQDMHPTRALFQIVRNPPPTLYRPANWTQGYNDFIAECLEKNPEHRPFMSEVIEHPFLQQLPENDFHLNAELKSLLEGVSEADTASRRPQVGLRQGCLKKGPSLELEPMYVEDLAGLEQLNEDKIVQQLEARYNEDRCYTFVGDVLLFINPNKSLDIYSYQNCCKYKFKSRSDNEPHIFAVADSAYQDLLHHEMPQNIVITGETMSGKTRQFTLILKHLLFLGMSGNHVADKIQKAVDIIHAFGNAATPFNSNSTRHALFSQITYSNSGKTSGAIFWLYQLEKWRVTGNRSPYHSNFHIFYYLYDGLSAEGRLEEYHLEQGRSYCYLRRQIEDSDVDPKAPSGPREEKESNPGVFRRLRDFFSALQFEEGEVEVVWKVLAAILLLGEVEYVDNEDGNADIKDNSIVENVASLLEVDSKKLAWSLCNYCLVEKDTAARRRHSRPEALAARNVFAQTLYARLVDWLVNMINHKLSFSRAIYGDHHYVGLLDIFGFECYSENGLEQLFVNSLNEQLQYFYIQKIFISEMQETEEEEMEFRSFQFYNNKDTMDEIFNKPHGIMHLLDEANKLNLESGHVIDCLDKKSEGSHVRSCGEEEFSIAHYTGKVTYDASSMCYKNRDFLPPEITEVMRFSTNQEVKQLFSNKLSRTGNLTLNVEKVQTTESETKKKRWGAALMNDTNRRTRSYNTASKGEFSQTRGIRTASATFRSVSLELLKALATGSTHFVRCLRSDLNGNPDSFQATIVKQQLRAMSVTDTAKARQTGYSHRITFPDFIQRYKFLAFDFDEPVEETKDNCRLLLIRLKLEGWHLGNSKVFLKYYNEEYLSRMYETQVKKIVKVQSMLRAFLAKRNVATKKGLKSSPSLPESASTSKVHMSEDEAAVIIQKNIKGFVARRQYGPLINVNSGKLDEETVRFIKRYFNRWKAKSIFQVLILYRAAKYQELVYFSQQAHLYNQNVVSSLRAMQKEKVNIKRVVMSGDPKPFVGEESPSVWKIPFRMKDLPFCESDHLRGSVAVRITHDDDLPWDEPFKKLDKGCQTFEDSYTRGDPFHKTKERKQKFNNFISTPYTRDPKTAELKYKEQNYKYMEEEEEDYAALRYSRGPSPQPRSPPEVRAPNRPVSPAPHQPSRRPAPQPVHRHNPAGPKLPNPVAELELIGRKIQKNDSTESDDPPFNFQAMLRKTNHNRKSLKRQAPDIPRMSITNHDDFQNNNDIPRIKTSSQKQKAPPIPKERQSKFKRLDSFENVKKFVGVSIDFERGARDKNSTDNGFILEENDNSYRTEILPGFVVVGGPTIDL